MKGEISIILGSKNDKDRLQDGFTLLEESGIEYQLAVISAHRHPDKLRTFCKKLEKDGVKVVIACAGMAAALPGFVASYVNLPVIGVALKGGMLDGLDALMSMTSVPKGLGLVSSGIGKSAFINAVIYSLQILALSDNKMKETLEQVKKKYR